MSEIRHWVQEVASQARLGHGPVEDLLTAVDEAASNAIRHGAPRVGGCVVVTCAIEPDGIAVTIRDNGGGFSVPHAPTMPGPEATGGRGLPLMCALADAVDIASGPNGTVVRIFKRGESAH